MLQSTEGTTQDVQCNKNAPCVLFQRSKRMVYNMCSYCNILLSFLWIFFFTVAAHVIQGLPGLWKHRPCPNLKDCHKQRKEGRNKRRIVGCVMDDVILSFIASTVYNIIQTLWGVPKHNMQWAKEEFIWDRGFCWGCNKQIHWLTP